MDNINKINRERLMKTPNWVPGPTLPRSPHRGSTPSGGWVNDLKSRSGHNLLSEKGDLHLLFIPIYEYDEPLLVVAQKRGYQKNKKYTLWDSVFTVEGEMPQPILPEGYVLQSMADENDLDRRRKAFGLGFNHPDPNDWPSLLAYQELQKAPDYCQDVDLYVVAPDGEFAAFCIIWWDEHNRIAMLEPVGTVPEYRRKGLARAVVLEAIRRVAALGAEKVFVGSDQEFYLSLGFEMKYAGHHWKKEF